ncbi:MAG: DHHA1 domain-containing protein [Intestinibacter sp.]|uniref:alanyl-tRNA editing protein n=1 Tax=Intestinibacter sp. TaxID=1965304 RepID=UPI002A809C22|nr:DHHA1 domain-containing protein [Intestinibacter sp.]MDY4576287.1 DHHA1 domain-containing protein [Intestinibacter sp.]
MQKLFYEDSEIKDFTCEVEKIEEIDGKYHVILDKTAFFPGGGGQLCDLGEIESCEVEDVYEKDGEIYHVLKSKPNKIHKVKCALDWNRREYSMVHHLAQHVVSALFLDEFKRKTTSFHMGVEGSSVDIEGSFSDDEICRIEKMANDIISENIAVECFKITKREAKKLKIKDDFSKINGDVRIVKVGDLDFNCCCGVHPKSTLNLKVIKFRKWEKYKDSTRIEYFAGNKAIEYIIDRDRYLSNICKYLSCSDQEAIKGIENINNKLKDCIKENKKLKEEIAEYEVKDIISSAKVVNGVSVINKIYTDKDSKYISKVSNKITEEDDRVVLFALANGDRANLVFSCSKNLNSLDMNQLLKDAIKLIDGKGGGSKTNAQGGGKNNSNLESLMNYAIMKLEKEII